MIKSFIKYYKPYKKLFILDLIVAAIAAGCDLVYPLMTRKLVNGAIPQKDFSTIMIFGGVLLLIYIVKMACAYFMQYWGHLVGVGMQADMRRDIYKHLQSLPVRFFDNNQTGSIMSRIVNDLMDISELAHHGPEDLFISLIMITGSFIILLKINVVLTLIIFAILPFIIWYSLDKRKKMLDAFMERREKTSIINSNLQNSISGIRVSKAFVNSENEFEKFKIGNDEFKNSSRKAYKVMAEYTAGVGFLTDLLDYTVLIFGGIFTYMGKINFGDFLAYLLYIKIFTQPIKRLIGFVEQYQNGMSGYKRFIEIIEEETEKDKENSTELKNVKGEIEFRNVTFAHEETEVLKDISIKIEAGKSVALVGPSGGGKTTFCNLIPRFYNINSLQNDTGEIYIDGININNIKLSSLREKIGIVQQDVFLFTGSVKENIAIGKSDATDEEIIDAAKKANIHEIIEKLPQGYDTQVGERGIKLSGGQKQRISIARIFLKNPPVLILDEATSALDNVTESLIQNSLNELCKGRTTIVVAHRLSTIKNSDDICVLKDGNIKERGTHEELLRKGGDYKSLYKATLSI